MEPAKYCNILQLDHPIGRHYIFYTCVCGKGFIERSSFDISEFITKISNNICLFDNLSELSSHITNKDNIYKNEIHDIPLPGSGIQFNWYKLQNEFIDVISAVEVTKKLVTLDETIKHLETENKSIKAENEKLKLALYYQPGGEGEKECKKHFTELQFNKSF